MNNIRRNALIALMAALIFVLTTVPRIPTPIGGYIHLGDAGVSFAACAFGPWVAMIAGAFGTALADLLGYPQWAIFSLLIHGAQGLAMGWLLRRVTWANSFLALLASTAIVVGGYFVAGAILEGTAMATLELLPNAVQALSGGLIGIPLYLAVRQAYPPLARYTA